MSLPALAPSRVLPRTLTCGCNPGMVYKTKNSLACHRSSMRHKNWRKRESGSSLRDLMTRVVELESLVTELRAHPRKRRHKRQVSEVMKKKVACRQDWACTSCHTKLPACYEVDHIFPLWRGGSNDMANLAAMCRNCHGTKTQDDLLRK